MTTSTSEPGPSTLVSVVKSTLSLLEQLQHPLVPPENSADSTQHDVEALSLAHDSASLIKAHSTKISLLIINKPFTPTAVTTVLRELVAGPLPGLASASELCTPAKYTKVMCEELRWRTRRTFTEIQTLIKAIPLDGQILSDNQKNGTGEEAGRGSLAVTGIVWKCCEDVMELKSLGISGLLVKKAEEYRALLKDAIDELQEWSEEVSDSEDEDDDDEDQDPAQKLVDDVFRSRAQIPKDDPENIRKRLESALKRLRLVVLMYQAVVKRRIKTLPVLPHPSIPLVGSSGEPGIISCMDHVLEGLKGIPTLADDLANSFYELDSSEIDRLMNGCFFKGFATASLLLKNWEGQNDEFTAWASKFQIAMNKGW